MVSVLELLAPVRAKKVFQLEELADKLVAGENIPAELIDNTLVASGKTPADLQAIIDRKSEVKRLVAIVRASKGAGEKLAAIESQIAAAEREFDNAREKLLAVREKHDGDRARLRAEIDAADRARDEILTQGKLPVAAWERLSEAEREASDANEAHAHALREVPTYRGRANEAARRLRSLESGTPVFDRGEPVDSDKVVKAERAARAAAEQHEASIPKLEAQLREARQRRDAVRAAILRELGAS